jgi:hypothetical protein
MKPFALFAVIFALALTAPYSVLGQKKKSKEDQYKDIVKLAQSQKPADKEKAYKQAEEFLTEFGAMKDDEQVGRILSFANRFRLLVFNQLLDRNKNAEAFAIGEKILDSDPENVYVKMNLAFAGFQILLNNRDRSYSRDAMDFAKESIAALEGGAELPTYLPFKDKDDVLANMYYIIGTFQLEPNIKEAASNLFKATTFESPVKGKSFPYYAIAEYYEAENERRIKAFQTRHASRQATDAEFQVEQEARLDLYDRMMDAYARAIKASEIEKVAPQPNWKERLAVIYKVRKGNETGIDGFIANVFSSPMRNPVN